MSVSVNHNIDIFVVRHGRSLGQDDITTYKSIGDCNIPLTEKGVRQSLAAGEFLSDYQEKLGISLSTIFNSTCLRTEQTAEHIQSILKKVAFLSRHSDPRVDKQKFGVFDGMFNDQERQEKQPAAFAKYEKQLHTMGLFYARPQDGESISDVFGRSVSILQDLAERQIPPTVIVTHGLVALCIEKALLQHSDEWLLEHMDTMKNCEIRHIYGNIEDGFKAETICDDPLLWLENRKIHGDFSALTA